MRRYRKIRVMNFVARLNIGGPAIQVISIAKHFSSGKFECLLVTGQLPEYEGDMTYLARENGVAPLTIRSLSRNINPVRDFIAFLKILFLILKFRPHIVHTHTAKAGTLGRIAAFLAGTPAIVHTFHGHVFRHYFGRIKTAIFSSIERFLARITDAVIAISPSQRVDLVKELKIVPGRKLAVLNFGIKLSPFLRSGEYAGVIRQELSIPTGAPVVSIVGRLCPVKDHIFFLHSAAALLRRRPDARFLIVGDGELRAELERLCSELDIAGSVHFLGWRRDLPAIYANSTVVAVTSLNEGTPVSLLEAMASAKPIVATSVGGVPDLFPDKQRDGALIRARTGILVDSRSPEVFADALLEVIQDEALQKEMGDAGREFAKENFSQERFFAELEKLYRAVLRG